MKTWRSTYVNKVFLTCLFLGFSNGLFAKSLEPGFGQKQHSNQFFITTVFETDEESGLYNAPVPPPPGDCTELFISEYIEGSSFNKAIEIYNPTNSAIDLTDYSIRYYNGTSTSVSGAYSSWFGTIGAYSTIVVANNSSALPGITSVADFTTTSSALSFNGNDAVALYKNNTLIDIVGPIGSNSNFAKDKTLVRNSTVAQGITTYDVNEWTEHSENFTDSLGNHFSGCNVPTCDTDTLIVYENCDSTTVGDSTYFVSTTVYDTLLNAANCDSIVTTQITVNTSYTDTLEELSGIDSVEVNGTYYYTSQTLNLSLTSVTGCDSLVQIPLNILSSDNIDTLGFQSFEISGDSWNYTLNQPIYNQSGDVWDSVQTLSNFGPTEGDYFWGMRDLVNDINVDDIHTLSFDPVDVSAYETISLTFDYYSDLVGGSDYVDYSIEFDNGTDWDSVVSLNNATNAWVTEEVIVPSGTQYVRLQLRGKFNGGSDYAGFDNIVLYGISEPEPCSVIDTIYSEMACDSFVYADSTYTVSTQIMDTLTQSGNSCDSIVTINLTINETNTETYTATTCSDTLEVNGHVYTSTGVYTQTLTNILGCDSLLTLDLTFNVPTSGMFSDTICSDSYTINGETFTASGTYTQTLTNTAGCDSTLTLELVVGALDSVSENYSTCEDSLEINGITYTVTGEYEQTLTNQYGCDSVLTLDLEFSTETEGFITELVCTDSITINGVTYDSTGVYTQTIVLDAGCDSILEIDLTFAEPTTQTIADTTCSGSLEYNGQTYTESGIYTQTLTNVAGCDSTLTLELVINEATAETITNTTCSGSLEYNGQTYTESGIYTQTLINTQGCDSVLTLNLTINEETSETLVESSCSGSISINGTVYTESGIYTQLLTNVAGCDSTLTLDLTINTETSGVYNETSCEDQITVNSIVYNTSGTYTQVLTNSMGCDSTLTLNLVMGLNSDPTYIYELVCESSIDINGTVYTTTGTYTQTLINQAGCDSVVNYQLNFSEGDSVFMDTVICGQNVFEYNGNLMTETGTYTFEEEQWTGCPTIITIDVEFVDEFTVEITQVGNTLVCNQPSGTFQWYDCDTGLPGPGETNSTFVPQVNSEYYVSVTQNGCTYSSECYTTFGIGLEENETSEFVIYPNPNQGSFTVKWDEIGVYSRFRVTTTVGQVIYESDVNGDQPEIDVDMQLVSGVYYIQMLNANNRWENHTIIVE